MRIAFVGKGGSGKTTCTALYASYLATQKIKHLVIDADFNMHVGLCLGFPEKVLQESKKVGEHGSLVKNYILGKNTRIANTKEIIKTTPPSMHSQFIYLDPINDPLLKKFVISHDNISLLITGTFMEEGIGSNCFHKYSGIVEILLNHLLEKDDEQIVIDMTAGVDAFGTGLFASFDITYMIVEPTLQSISVFRQYKNHAEKYNINIKAIGNKVDSIEDENFLKKELGTHLVSSLGMSEMIKDFQKGKRNGINYKDLERNNQKKLKKIFDHDLTIRRDWNNFYLTLLSLHKKNNDTWAQKFFKKDLNKQIDPNFSYQKMLDQTKNM